MLSGLFEIRLFIHRMLSRRRVGDASRRPLRMVRFEVNGNSARCEWIARSPDPWDDDLNPVIGLRHASEQALKDAIEVRHLLFTLMPDVDLAEFRAYRDLINGERELIIAGQVHRYAAGYRQVASIAMRAKLFGLCFVMENGILCGTVVEDPHEFAA